MFPTKTVRLIVPFGKDGATDTLARLIAARLAQGWGHEVMVENHPGNGAVDGTLLAAQAVADGHTLLLGTSTTHCIAPALRADLPYQPSEDFLPLSLAGWAPNLLLVPAKGPEDVAALIARARASPGTLTYASAGAGQTIHLCAALFAQRAQLRLIHKPYAQGSDAGLQDLIAGKVDLMFDNVLSALPHIRREELRALAVAGSTRCAALPAVPTLAEAAVAGYAADVWIGLFAPAGTPLDTTYILKRDITTVLGQTDLIGELGALGLMLDVKPGAEFAAEIADNAVQWQGIVAAGKPA
jgi:tripartite-type tricarboxylate transporter receptor subunit TctC